MRRIEETLQASSRSTLKPVDSGFPSHLDPSRSGFGISSLEVDFESYERILSPHHNETQRLESQLSEKDNELFEALKSIKASEAQNQAGLNSKIDALESRLQDKETELLQLRDEKLEFDALKIDYARLIQVTERERGREREREA